MFKFKNIFLFNYKLFLPIHWLPIGQTFEIIKEWKRSENINAYPEHFNPTGLYRQGLSPTNLSCNFQWKQERLVTIYEFIISSDDEHFIKGLIVQYGIILLLRSLFRVHNYYLYGTSIPFHSILFRISYFDDRNKNQRAVPLFNFKHFTCALTLKRIKTKTVIFS